MCVSLYCIYRPSVRKFFSNSLANSFPILAMIPKAIGVIVPSSFNLTHVRGHSDAFVLLRIFMKCAFDIEYYMFFQLGLGGWLRKVSGVLY